MTDQPSRSASRPSRPRPDVIVIGGGIVGVSCAAHLAARGRRVVLFERMRLAAGASGRNSGVVQHPFDPVLVELHLATLSLYRALERDGVGFRLPTEPAGLLLVTHEPPVAQTLAAVLARSHPGLSPTFVDADEARTLEPSLAPGVAACRLAMGFPVAPAAATRAYAAQAKRLGAEVRVGEGARPWLASGAVAGVELAGGERLAAGDVVVATGPWTPDVIDPSGRWQPIRSSWGVVVALTLAGPPGHVLEEAEIDIEPGGGQSARAPADPTDPGHPDDPGRVVGGGPAAGAGRPAGDGPAAGAGPSRSRAHAAQVGNAFSLVTAGGESSLGSTFLDDEPDPAAIAPALLVRGATYVPAIASARAGAHRVCARPLSFDGRPLVGRVPGVEGLWIAAGHGPWGISTGPASGRLIADLLDGRVAQPPAALDPSRYPPPPLG